MKRILQKLTVAAALRLVHAALVELYKLDPYVRAQFCSLPNGTSYSIYTGHDAPVLHVCWDGQKLLRLKEVKERATCELHLKSLADSFLMFTGQIGLAQGYARHAFSMQGEIADVMRLARLVNRAEAYLFPPFLSRRILPEVPSLPVSSLRLYGHLIFGFLTRSYS